MQGQAVHDGGHAELAHAVVDVASAVEIGIALGRRAQHLDALPGGEVATGEVGRATQQFRQGRPQVVERALRGSTGGDVVGFHHRVHHQVVHDVFPVGRQHAAHAALQLGSLFGELGSIGIKGVLPAGMALGAHLSGIPGRVQVGRDLEGRLGPAQGFAGGNDFLGTQRFAMGLGRAGPVGRTLADDGLADDDGGRKAQLAHAFAVDDRPASLAPVARLRDGLGHGPGIMAVDRVDDVPAIGSKALGHVLAVPALDVAVDGDAVVVVEHDELGQAPDGGQGAGLVRDAFHQAAVAGKHPGEVVDDVVAGAVELGSQQLLGQGHAHSIGQPLPQRTSGGLHTRRDTYLGVTRGLGMQLAEVLDVVDGEVIAGEMQQRVQQHRAVAVGEHEAVTVEPPRLGGIMLEVCAPQGHGDVGHAHGHARVAGAGLLDGVHGQHADGVGHAAGGVRRREGRPAGGHEGLGRLLGIRQGHVVHLGDAIGPSHMFSGGKRLAPGFIGGKIQLGSRRGFSGKRVVGHGRKGRIELKMR